MPTFAIVIPNLNQSHFLPWALESLRYQSQPFNLALMDGGSTDHFHDVVRAYSDIITFLSSAPDAGQAAAIREGKKRVQGDIVSWLNADDYYFPGALDKVASLFEHDPDLDVVYGDAIHVTPEGFFLSYFPPIQAFNAEDLTRSCFICQPACFVRRSAYNAVGGIDPALHYTMDWDLWCRLSKSGAKFEYMPELLAAVRYYPGTKTLDRDWLRYKEIWRIERKYGRRPLPLSWAGFYRFDLSYKSRRTASERISLRILDRLRGFKKRLYHSQGLSKELNRPIYGFQRWEPVVEGRCTIHMPWYDRRDWKRLNLEVEPGDADYRVVLHSVYDQTLSAQRGRLCVDVPGLDGPLRKISIMCPGRPRWRLLGFSCDLD